MKPIIISTIIITSFMGLFGQEQIRNNGFESHRSGVTFPTSHSEAELLYEWKESIPKAIYHSPDWYKYESYFRFFNTSSSSEVEFGNNGSYGYIGMKPCEGLSQKLSQKLKAGDEVVISFWYKVQTPDNEDSNGENSHPPMSSAIILETIFSNRKINYFRDRQSCTLDWNIFDKKQKEEHILWTGDVSSDYWQKYISEPIIIQDDQEWFFFHIHDESEVPIFEYEVNFNEYLLIDDFSVKRLSCEDAQKTCEYTTGSMNPYLSINTMDNLGTSIVSNLDNVHGFYITLLDVITETPLYVGNTKICPNGFKGDFHYSSGILNIPASVYIAELTFWNEDGLCSNKSQNIVFNRNFEFTQGNPENYCPCRPLNIQRNCCEEQLEAEQYVKICNSVDPEYSAISELLVGVNNSITVNTGDLATFNAGNSILIGSGFTFQDEAEAVFEVKPCTGEGRPASSPSKGNSEQIINQEELNAQPLQTPETPTPFELRIFPNPTSGLVHLVNPSNESGQVFVFTASGSLITQKRISANETLRINLPSKGLYLIRFSNTNHSKVYKVIHE